LSNANKGLSFGRGSLSKILMSSQDNLGERLTPQSLFKKYKNNPAYAGLKVGRDSPAQNRHNGEPSSDYQVIEWY
jgi:hypothetical protein